MSHTWTRDESCHTHTHTHVMSHTWTRDESCDTHTHTHTHVMSHTWTRDKSRDMDDCDISHGWMSHRHIHAHTSCHTSRTARCDVLSKWRYAFIRQTRFNILCVTWHDCSLCVFDMTPTAWCDVLIKWRYAFIHVSRCIPLCLTWHDWLPDVWHDTTNLNVCDMTGTALYDSMCDMTRLISVCWHDTTNLCMCDMTRLISTCVTWQERRYTTRWWLLGSTSFGLGLASSFTVLCVKYDSFIFVTWLIHTCEMMHSYVCHDFFIHMTWLIHVCDMTYSCVWHDDFKWSTRLIRPFLLSCFWHFHSQCDVSYS